MAITIFFSFMDERNTLFGELKEKLNKVPLLLGSTGYLQLQNAKARIILSHWTILTQTAAHTHSSMLRAEDKSHITQLDHVAEGAGRVGFANVLFSPLLPSFCSLFLSHKLLQLSDLAFQSILGTNIKFYGNDITRYIHQDTQKSAVCIVSKISICA